MVDRIGAQWQNRAHVFAVAEQMIRRILLDHPRTHIAEKHGGVACELELDQAIRIPRRRDLYLVSLDARGRDAQGSFDFLAASRLRKQPDNRVEPARAYSKMVSIAARRKGQRAERLAEGVSLKQKILSLYAQTKDRMTGGLASEVKAVERDLDAYRGGRDLTSPRLSRHGKVRSRRNRYLKPAAVPTRKQSV